MKVYIASPFFKPAQVEFVKMIEDSLADNNIPYYSPRSEGVLIHQTEEEKAIRKKRIYDANVFNIKESTHVLAVIDDRDIGTIWEMGYATAYGIPVVTISNNKYGLNVMLAESVQAHTLFMNDALRALTDPAFQGELVDMKGIH